MSTASVITSTAASVPKSWSGPALTFSIIKECSTSRCRTANLVLPHHTLHTPTFMPVGTKGTMKGLLPEQVARAGADIILGNTYHLGTQPGAETLLAAGGLHRWMGWTKGLLTDSGGFQMVSLLKFAKVTEQGVTFQSPYDGTECVLTPEESIGIQNAIGADIMMQLDDVVDVRETDYDRFKEATLRTTRWLDRCIAANSNPDSQNLFPIVQGGLFTDLRELSLTQLLQRDSPGYAVGGLSGGEDKHQFWSTVHQCTARLPLCKPRYCMGVGFAPDLVVCVALGVDMFDCVYPTRTARFGCALVNTGQISLKREQYADDFQPLDDECDCRTCQKYTRAYIHAALASKATVACHLISVHNIAYQMRLMCDIRSSVRDDRFPQFAREFLDAFYGGSDNIPQWITEALAAVNISFTESESRSSIDGNLITSTSDIDSQNQTTTISFEDSPVLRHFCNLSVDDAKLNTEKTSDVTDKPINIVQDTTNDWCDDNSDSDRDQYTDKLSGFESKAYDQGYRETLRRDYPDAEEEGRIVGFRQAFNAVSSFGDKNRTNATGGNGSNLKTMEKGNSTNIHPIKMLAMQEGSLSLLLLKHQLQLTDLQMREVISCREGINLEISRISTDCKIDLIAEGSAISICKTNIYNSEKKTNIEDICCEKSSFSAASNFRKCSATCVDSNSTQNLCFGKSKVLLDNFPKPVRDIYFRIQKVSSDIGWHIPDIFASDC